MKKGIRCLALAFVVFCMALVIPRMSVVDVFAKVADSPETAQSVTFKKAYSNKLENSGATRWYKVTLPANGYIYTKMKPSKAAESSSDGWFVSILDKNQTVITRLDDVRASSSATQESTKVGLHKGVYYIKISAVPYYWTNIPFSLAVYFQEAANWENERYGSEEIEINPINVNAAYYGSISENGDIDDYKFTMPNKGAISIDLKAMKVDSYNGWRLRILDSKRETITTLSDIDADTTTVKKTTTVGLPKGTYYFRISAKPYYRAEVPYCFRVNYKAKTNWETERNGLDIGCPAKNIRSITLGTAYFGSLSDSSDIDDYKLLLQNTGTISFDWKALRIASGGGWTIRILDLEQNEITSLYGMESDTLSNQRTATVGLPKGTYYIRISHKDYSWTDVPYRFVVNATVASNWETERNDLDGGNKADIIKINTTYNGSLTTGSDVDDYKLTLSQKGKLQLAFQGESSSYDAYGAGWKIMLLDKEQKVLKVLNEVGGGTGVKKSEKVTLKKGTYYIRVVHRISWWKTDTTYSFKVLFS